MSSNSTVNVDIHRPELGKVVDLFKGEQYADREDAMRTVTVKIAPSVTLYFGTATAAHDFATDLHAAIEELWAAREAGVQ